MRNRRAPHPRYLLRQIRHHNRVPDHQRLRHRLLQVLLPAPLLQAAVILVRRRAAELVVRGDGERDGAEGREEEAARGGVEDEGVAEVDVDLGLGEDLDVVEGGEGGGGGGGGQVFVAEDVNGELGGDGKEEVAGITGIALSGRCDDEC